MEQELTLEDWKQVAGFYQSKANDLEMRILSLELNAQKANLQTEPRPAKEFELPEVKESAEL